MIVIIQCKTDTMDLPFQTERASRARVGNIAFGETFVDAESRRPKKHQNFPSSLNLQGLN